MVRRTDLSDPGQPQCVPPNLDKQQDHPKVPIKDINREKSAMSQENQHHRKDHCALESGDCTREHQLCCCYILDEQGNYDDPCYTPIEDNCCC